MHCRTADGSLPVRARLLAAAAALTVAAPALAQSDAPSATTKADEVAIRIGDAPRPEHALGDWAGLRTRLVDQGIDLKFGYLTETMDVADGGIRQGIDYAQQIKLQADIDLGTLAGWRGWSLHGTLLERAGRSASADYLHDDLDQVQEIFGATDHAAGHLGQFYLEHTGGSPITLDEKAGRLPVGADFAGSPLYCQYLSLGLCPQPRGLSLEGAFSVDPSSTWGARVRGSASGFYLMAGAYQVRPRYGGPSGFDWGFSHTTGAILPLEAGLEPRFGGRALQGHYKAGLAFDTSNYPDFTPGGPAHGHRTALYVLADQMLVRTGKDGTAGLILLGGWTHGDPGTTIFRDFGFVGLSAAGLIRARPHDSIELLVSDGEVSGVLTRAQRLAMITNSPLPTGFPPAPGSFAGPVVAPGVQTREIVAEANYAVHLASGLLVTPDVQYVVRPAAAASIANALVVGARLELNL
jgi:porin